MKNEELKITLQNTNNGNIIGLQNKFTTIFYEQYKKWQEAQPFQKIAPIDLVINVNETDLNKTEFDSLFLHHINAAKTASINKINAEKFLKTATNYFTEVKSIEKKVPLLTIPLLIEIIVTHFIESKQTKRLPHNLRLIRKTTWQNIINKLQNTPVEKEQEVINSFLKVSTSKNTLFNPVKELSNFIIHLVKNQKIVLTKKTASYNYNSKEPFVFYIRKAVEELYYKNPQLPKEVKSFWENFVFNILTNNRKIPSIFKNPLYHEITTYISKNISFLRKEAVKSVQQNIYENANAFSDADHEKKVSKQQLIQAIIEKYLSNDGLLETEFHLWLDIIENLINNTTTVLEILSDKKHLELRVFIYTEFLKNYSNFVTTIINLETYREIIVVQIKRIIDTFAVDNIHKNQKIDLHQTLKRCKYFLKEGIPLIKILSKHPDLYVVLALIFDIEKLSDATIYPEFIKSFKEFTESYWYDIYKNNNLQKVLFSQTFELDEVHLSPLDKTIQVQLNTSSSSIRDGGTGKNYHYYNVSPQNLFDFIVYFKGFQIFKHLIENYRPHTPINYVTINKKVTIGHYIFSIQTHSDNYQNKPFVTALNLNRNAIQFNIESSQFKLDFIYSIYVNDINGNKALSISSSDFQAMKYLFHEMNYKLSNENEAKIISVFKNAIKNANGNPQILDGIYASLPATLYKDIAIPLNEGKESKLLLKELDLDNETLLKQIKLILNTSVDTFGSNEERAVMKMLIALDDKFLYDKLATNNKLLFKIYDKLGDYIFVKDTAFKRFTDYFTNIIVKYSKQKANATVWFENSHWYEADYTTISLSTWTENTNTITITNKASDTRFGKEENILLNDSFKLLDLVEFKTLLPDIHGNLETVSVVKIPVFFLYAKYKDAKKINGWQVVFDILSIITIGTGVGTLISASAKTLAKLVALGLITKEISSLAIQNRHITASLQKDHSVFLTTWRAIDAVGDIALVLTSLPDIVNFIKRGKDLGRGLNAQGIAIHSRMKELIEQAKKLRTQKQQQLKEIFDIPEFRLISDGMVNLPIKHQLLMVSANIADKVNDLFTLGRRNKLSNRTQKYYQQTVKELKEYFLKNRKQIGHELLAIERALDGNKNVYNNLLKLEELRFKHLKNGSLNSTQLYFLKELRTLKNLEDKHHRILLKYILEVRYPGKTAKEALESLKAGKVYDPDIPRKWRNADKREALPKIDKLEKTSDLKPNAATQARLYYNNVNTPSKSFEQIIEEVSNGYTYNPVSKRLIKPSTVEKATMFKRENYPHSSLSKTNIKRSEIQNNQRRVAKKDKNIAEQHFLDTQGLTKKALKNLPKKEKAIIKLTPTGITLSKAIGKLLGISEELGNIGVKAWIRAKYGDGYRLMKVELPGKQKQGEFDFAITLPNGDIIIIDAKGAGSSRGSRGGYEQGHPKYTQDIINNMKTSIIKEIQGNARKMEKAWSQGKLQYLFITQGIKKSGDLKDYLKIEHAKIN